MDVLNDKKPPQTILLYKRKGEARDVICADFMEKYREHRPAVCLYTSYLTEQSLYDNEVTKYRYINVKRKSLFTSSQELPRKMSR